ncbi:MAG: class I SAM-dependent methyltransferase [Planctomycetes bacterium]|nr:class I SAM-dependent methyltransferase [Planctomycetota bacterium]
MNAPSATRQARDADAAPGRCPCGERGARPVLVSRRKRFQVVECLFCGLKRTDPPPYRSVGESRDLYDEADASKNGPGEATALRHAARNIGHLERLLSRRAGRLLDVGCGNGHHLAVAREHGWTVEGVEMDARRAARAREVFGLFVVQGAFEEAAARIEGRFDAVLMSNILEHLVDPVGALRAVAGLLAPGGMAYVDVPNFASARVLILGGNTPHLEPREHLWQFEPATLAALARRAGLRPAAVETRRFNRWSWRETRAAASLSGGMRRAANGLALSALSTAADVAGDMLYNSRRGNGDYIIMAAGRDPAARREAGGA